MRELRVVFRNYFPVFCFALVVLVLFTLCRVAFLLYNYPSHLTDTTAKTYALIFLNGLRFDAAVTGWLLLPLLLIRFAEDLLKLTLTGLFAWTSICLSVLAVFCACADLPYYRFFGNHLHASALSWLTAPELPAGMLLADSSYLITAFSAAGIALIAGRILHRIAFRHPPRTAGKISSLFVFLLVTGVTILAMRGRLASKTPLHEGNAIFSSEHFYNQAGLNALFTLVRSASAKDPGYLLARLPAPQEHLQDVLPVARTIPSFPEAPQHIVLVLMESMSSAKTGALGGKCQTPKLMSIADSGMYFDQFYSAGIHTFNGIFSVVTGYPALFDEHPLYTYTAKPFDGLATGLGRMGYTANFFTAHDPQFDNMEGFLTLNGFAAVRSAEEERDSESIGPMGVPDHSLFDYVLQHIDRSDGRTFSMVLTASDHTPFRLPDNPPFPVDGTTPEEKATSYADQSIGYFMSNARKKAWFPNTLFIFVADHGVNLGHTGTILPLSYNSIPCIFYQPSRILPMRYSSPAGQVDLLPTLMGLLGRPDTYFGTDLLESRRRCMPFTGDFRLGVAAGDTVFACDLQTGQERLFLRRKPTGPGLELPAKADELKNFASAMLNSARKALLPYANK